MKRSSSMQLLSHRFVCMLILAWNGTEYYLDGYEWVAINSVLLPPPAQGPEKNGVPQGLLKVNFVS